jgi:hypothetical protein
METTATPVAVNSVVTETPESSPEVQEVLEDSFSLAGLMSGVEGEERALVLLDVVHNGQKYEWKAFVPPGTEDLGQFVEGIKAAVLAEIDAKEAAWEALDPKTRTIDDPFGITDFEGGGASMVVPIDKSEVVCPEIPDYYAKRRAEYPPLSEQLDAFWKGPESQAYQGMLEKIAQVKAKYPKP